MTTKNAANQQLTIGPVLFHWDGPTWRDFYFRIADEAPVDTVYVGEVICSKRTPFIEPHYEEVAERLSNAGKTVVFSTLSEVMIKRDRKIVGVICETDNFDVEANDSSALYHLRGRQHRIGPFLNAYNEETLETLAGKGAHHFTLPPELPAEAIANLATKAKELDVSLEVQVYGRMGLALSARCYHARAHGRIKDTCQFVCGEDPDGLDLKTIAGKPFLTINGIQTLSYTCLNLMQELTPLAEAGISHFRLSPHSNDMVETSRLFRAVLDGERAPAEAIACLKDTALPVPFCNGFYHGEKGYAWIENDFEGAALDKVAV